MSYNKNPNSVKQAKFVSSLNAAAEGFIYVMKSQRNMRIHFLLAIIVLLLAIYLDLSKTDLLFLFTAIGIVLICEMFNTSLEMMVDLVESKVNPVIKIIKDVSAGAVFISAVNAVVIGYIVFSQNLTFKLEDGIYKIKHSSWHMTFIALIVVLFLVVLGKVISRKGTPFRGGMPSGHAAFAFSLGTVIAFLTEQGIIAFLSFVMACLIARHRVITKIHTVWEVVVGSFLGMLSTALIFQLLK